MSGESERSFIQELLLSTSLAIVGFVGMGVLLGAQRPKPRQLTQAEWEARNVALRDQWEAHEAEQRHLLAKEIAEELRRCPADGAA